MESYAEEGLMRNLGSGIRKGLKGIKTGAKDFMSGLSGEEEDDIESTIDIPDVNDGDDGDWARPTPDESKPAGLASELKIYIASNGQTHGPYSGKSILKYYKDGKVKDDTLVSSKRTGEKWEPFKKVYGNDLPSDDKVVDATGMMRESILKRPGWGNRNIS